ncbi:dienelactone hydrolase family protein [Catellatospora sichuanensis]|uniref:dienelactone hydrolase family protein n=1 Tax=Catellatospora sichuanensis TaxID=1969805 RepID=UPI0011823908|nr:acetylesterase [Catellatospora sichuanensis]
MIRSSAHLGSYSDLSRVAVPRRDPAVVVEPRDVIGLLDFAPDDEPREPRVDGRWSRDGVDGEEVSWSVGYGPRTRAWLLRPAARSGPLPGVVALHSHDGAKFHGKEKIADGPHPAGPDMVALRERSYGGRAFANELARRGFVVLVHDVFLWGSRRFDASTMAGALGLAVVPDDDPAAYNPLASRHEHLVAKYCTVLGTSMAALVAYEDRVAARYLASRAEVVDGPLGCVGLSGGGARAALLSATSPRIGATVITGMMTTHDAMLDRHVAGHTWMFFPPGLPRLGDWPDVAGCRAPSPLLVQYLRDDHLFPLDGMEAADRRLGEIYRHRGAPAAYVGEFHPGDHRFDLAMQESAFARLSAWLT